jgi:hypothetical protein
MSFGCFRSWFTSSFLQSETDKQRLSNSMLRLSYINRHRNIWIYSWGAYARSATRAISLLPAFQFPFLFSSILLLIFCFRQIGMRPRAWRVGFSHSAVPMQITLSSAKCFCASWHENLLQSFNALMLSKRVFVLLNKRSWYLCFLRLFYI